jgi:hypothetical protein
MPVNKEPKVLPAIRERTPFVLIPWGLADRTMALYQFEGETICVPLKDYLLGVAETVGRVGAKTGYGDAPAGIVAGILP